MKDSGLSKGLYDPDLEHSACGVGFVTRKDSSQTHELLLLGHQALCAVPHRGGMSSEGVGDGAGISIDLSVSFFSRITERRLSSGSFGVGNFFLPSDEGQHERATQLVEEHLTAAGLKIIKTRELPVDKNQIRSRAVKWQLPIKQWIFMSNKQTDEKMFERQIHRALLSIEAVAYSDSKLDGLYPLSMSSRLQVLKGRLNSWELIPYFFGPRRQRSPHSHLIFPHSVLHEY